MSAHPPWDGRAAPPERTADGREIIHTRFGAFVIREDGHPVPYYPPGVEIERLLRDKPRPFRDRTDWNPLDDG
jgi:hypothetical protein